MLSGRGRHIIKSKQEHMAHAELLLQQAFVHAYNQKGVQAFADYVRLVACQIKLRFCRHA